MNMPVDSHMHIDSRQLPEQATSNGHKRGTAMNGNGLSSSLEHQSSDDDDDLPLVRIAP